MHRYLRPVTEDETLVERWDVLQSPKLLLLGNERLARS